MHQMKYSNPERLSVDRKGADITSRLLPGMKVKGDDLPNNGNVWQTIECVKLENKGTSK